VVSESDSWSRGRGFDSRPLHCQAHCLLCGQIYDYWLIDWLNVPLFTKQYNLVPCEGFHVNAPYVAANCMGPTNKITRGHSGVTLRSSTTTRWRRRMNKGSIVVAVLQRSDRLEPRYKLSTLLFFTEFLLPQRPYHHSCSKFNCRRREDFCATVHYDNGAIAMMAATGATMRCQDGLVQQLRRRQSSP